MKKKQDKADLSVNYRETTGGKSIRTSLVSRSGTLQALAAEDKALFLALDELNAEDLGKLKTFLDSLDHEPIFIAADQATCD